MNRPIQTPENYLWTEDMVMRVLGLVPKNEPFDAPPHELAQLVGSNLDTQLITQFADWLRRHEMHAYQTIFVDALPALMLGYLREVARPLFDYVLNCERTAYESLMTKHPEPIVFNISPERRAHCDAINKTSEAIERGDRREW